MDIKGKIIAVLEKKSGMNERGTWAVQEYVLETLEKFPHKLVFEAFTEEKIQEFKIQLGEVVTVKFEFHAQEYKGRWYNKVRAWEVNREPVVKQENPLGGNDNPFGNPSQKVPF